MEKTFFVLVGIHHYDEKEIISTRDTLADIHMDWTKYICEYAASLSHFNVLLNDDGHDDDIPYRYVYIRRYVNGEWKSPQSEDVLYIK
jgi:hypothetical protein